MGNSDALAEELRRRINQQVPGFVEDLRTGAKGLDHLIRMAMFKGVEICQDLQKQAKKEAENV